MLVVVGDLVEDIVVWADEPVRRATDTSASVFRARGGSGANVAALAAAQVPTRFIGRVGADAAGDALIAALARTGVDVRVQRATAPARSCCSSTPTASERCSPIGPRPPCSTRSTPRGSTGRPGCTCPPTGSSAIPCAPRCAGSRAVARSAGARVSVDASSTGLLSGIGVDLARELIRGLAPDVLFADEAEAELLGLTGGGPVAASLAPLVVLKHGPRPTDVVRDGDLVQRVDVLPVAGVRDLTGAGDAFAAGFLAATMGGAEVVAACRAGHSAAASVLTSPGARAETRIAPDRPIRQPALTPAHSSTTVDAWTIEPCARPSPPPTATTPIAPSENCAACASSST